MKSLKYFLISFVFLLLVFLAWKFYGTYSENKSSNSYTSYTVQRKNIQKRILTTGLVQPFNRLEIKAPIAGRAEEVLVNEGDSVYKGQILAWMSSTERAVLLDAARAKGAETLKYWETLYKATPLIAPLDGNIIAKNIQSGQSVTQQDAVLVMSDKLIVKAQVDETDIGSIYLNQEAEIVLDAYSDEKLHSKVAHIAFEAKTVNNVTVYEVDLLPEKVPLHMRSGMSATVTFLGEERKQVLALPVQAVEKAKGKNRVWINSKQNSKELEPLEIQLGLSDGREVEVLAGLQENDYVFVKSRSQREGNSSNTTSNPFTPNVRMPRR